MATVNSPTHLRWQPYGSGPNTAHIVWNQPIKSGGIIGGDYGSLSYASSRQCTLVNRLWSWTAKYSQIFSILPADHNTLGAPSANFNASIRQLEKYCIQRMDQLPMVSTYLETHIHNPLHAVALGQATVLLESSYGSYYTSIPIWNRHSHGVTYWNYYDPLTGTLNAANR